MFYDFISMKKPRYKLRTLCNRSMMINLANPRATQKHIALDCITLAASPARGTFLNYFPRDGTGVKMP